MIWIVTKLTVDLATECAYWGVKTGLYLVWYAGGSAYRSICKKEENPVDERKQLAYMKKEIEETKKRVDIELVELKKLKKIEKRKSI